MKLRLPHKFQAALMAALASVSFTTLSTGTLTAAAGTALLAGQQARAAEMQGSETWDVPRTGTTVSGKVLSLTKISCDKNQMDSGAVKQNSVFAPNVNVGNGSGTWTLTFTIQNNAEYAVTLKDLLLDVSMFTSSGDAQNTSTNRSVVFTLKQSGAELGKVDTVMQGRGNVTQASYIFNGQSLTEDKPVLTFGEGVELGKGASIEFTLTTAQGSNTAYRNGCFFGLLDMVASYTYQASECVWIGTEGQAWGDGEAWTGGVPTSSTPAIFNGSGASAVSITSAAEAASVTVSGQDYTFNIQSGGALTATNFAVEGGNQTVNLNGGSLTPGNVTIATDATLNITGSGDMSISSLAGAGGFVKDSSGTLVLNGNNSSYSGAITVNEGTLDITNWNSLGSQAPTAGANGTIQLTTDSLPNSLTVNGEGTLRLLTRQGGQNVNLKTIKAPTLKLAADSGHNSRFVYEAGSDISEVQHLYFDGGQLWLNSGDTVLNYGGTITFGTENHYSEGGGLDSAFRVNASAKFSGAVDVQKAAKITWQTGGKYVEFANAVTGSGNLTLATYNGGQYSNSRFIISGDASKYTGSITTSHTCITVEVASGGKLAMGSNSNLTGAVTLAGEIIVNDSATISGAITGAGTLTKNGAGTLVLSGANTYSGGTEVNGGTLQAASAGALGSGDVTVNGGTLELTSSVTTTGALTINDGGTLKLAGENMLTADTLALGSGTVTFDLSNISVSHARTITLATATTSASLGSATVNIVWNGLNPIFHYDSGVQVDGNSWIITLTADSQKLTWAGGEGDWSHSPEDTHWLDSSEQPSAFAANDTAIFAAGEPAVANIKEAINAAGLEIQAGANVTLQKAESAETATLNTLEMDIAGSLATSVDVTASAVEAAGANAAWNITAGTVTADSITVEENGKLALSGTGMEVKTVSGPGTVEVGRDFTLTLSQQIDSEQATDLSIRNNGTVVVELGSSQNVINMDAASTGTLEVTAGTISSQSALGAGQTLKLAGGTVFAVKGGETAFASDITLAGDVAMQLKDSANATIAGAVSGEGKTLTVSGGAANQVVTFTDTVTLGGLNVSGSGEKLVFQGTGSSLGAIYAQNGAFTIQFSKADGDETASHTFGTFAMAPTSGGARWLIVDNGVTVQGTGNGLSESSTICSAYDVSGGGLDVNGTLQLAGKIGFDGPGNSTIKGSGLIETTGLNISNGTTTTIQGGVVIDITSSAGVYKRAGGNSTLNLANATLKATSVDWEMKNDGHAVNTVNLTDASTGTTFDAATGRTITLSKAMGGTGKLVKVGDGTVLLTGANTYSGGTEINAGTLAVAGNGAIGAVTIGENGILRMDKGYNFSNTVSGAGKMTYAGTTDATLNFGGQDISGWTGNFNNTGTATATLNITRGDEHVKAAIGNVAGGTINITSENDVYFDNVVNINDISHNPSHTLYIGTDGDLGIAGAMTVTGHASTGRLVVGFNTSDSDAVFTLSGENARLSNGSDHTYDAKVQGYGTFAVVGGAKETLTGDLINSPGPGFHGTFAADGQGSVLTLNTTLASDVTFKATNGGEIILTQTYTMGDNTAVNGGTVKVNNGLTVNGTVDLSKGTLTQTGGTITVNEGKSLTLGNASITSAIDNSGAVTFTQDITATGLTGGQRDYLMGLDGQQATVANFFAGTEEYLTVVTGGTVTTNGRKVTQGGKDYLLDTDGTAAGDKDIDYTYFFQYEGGSTLDYSDIFDMAVTQHGADMVYAIVANRATLNVDQNVAAAMLDSGTVNIEGGVTFNGYIAMIGGDGLDTPGNKVMGQIATSMVGYAQDVATSTVFTDAPVENGGVRFTSETGSVFGGVRVDAVATTGKDLDEYSIGNTRFAVGATKVEMTGSADATIAHSVVVDKVHNSAGTDTGKLTLGKGANASFLKEVVATSGNVEFQDMAEANGTEEGKQTSVYLNNLEIGAGRTVSFYEATAPTSVEDMVRESAVTVKDTLTVGDGGTLNADLVMKSGSVMDVSAAQEHHGLNLGCSLTIEPGARLGEADMEAIAGLTMDNRWYFLDTSVEQLHITGIGSWDATQGQQLTFTDYSQFDLDASRVYTELDSQRYAMVYNWAPAGANVGTYTLAIYLIPEPTTGTLSLLALAALAARRRRK